MSFQEAITKDLSVLGVESDENGLYACVNLLGLNFICFVGSRKAYAVIMVIASHTARLITGTETVGQVCDRVRNKDDKTRRTGMWRLLPHVYIACPSH